MSASVSAMRSVLLMLVPAILLTSLATSARADTQTITIGYLEWLVERPPLLSNVLPPPDDAGLQGALLGIEDNNAGGRFLGLHYELEPQRSYDRNAVLEAARRWRQTGLPFVLTHLPTDLLREVSAILGEQTLILNIGNADDELRASACLGNTLHTLPSRAMLTDALAQWLIRKKLKRWLLIEGQRQGDRAFAEAMRRSARKFGGKIVAEKTWTFDTDLRRSAQTEVPLFTQTREYDAVVVADEPGDFGEFLLYNTWYPRPVVGTQGLMPTAWHRVVEQWGAAQLQSRFDHLAERWMVPQDYAAWAAVRSIGESLASGVQSDATSVRTHLLSDQFELAGFKGRKLTYRPWNGQLRQPIPLVHARALVSQSPQQGYLHRHTELDTLGLDQPESRCRLQN